MYNCTVTHKYDFPKYLKKAVEYFKRSSIPPLKVSGAFVVVDIRSFVCLVGEGATLKEFDSFMESARQSSVYIAETYNNRYYGYDDLVACEIDFYKNQMESARKHAHQAVLKAREKKQYSVEAVATQYLLQIAMHEGNYSLTKQLLNQLKSYLDNPDFWNGQVIYDVVIGYFYAQLGLTDMIPFWLVMDDKDMDSEVRIPIRELIVSAKGYIASKNYKHALTILCNSFPRQPQHRFLFGELTFSLLTAVARLNTGDIAGAVKDFEKAYLLSFNGVFELPFIELGKNLRPLVSAIVKQKDCAIPHTWLTTINNKASAYAKKIAFILSDYKKDNKIEDIIQLSERELEVLKDLYLGLSREEIADTRYLSINTVKKLLQSIYTKLDATNNVDAVRIAIDKNLI